MLHATCDAIRIARYHFLKSKMAAMYFDFSVSEYNAFLSQFAFENVGDRTKTVLVTIALNTRNLSKH